MQRANYYHVVTLPENCLIHLCIGHSQSWDQSTKNHSIMWTYVCASRITKTVFFWCALLFRMLILSMGRARFAARGLLSCSHTAKWNCQRFIYVLAAHSLEAHRPNTIVWCEHTCAQHIQRKYLFFGVFQITLLSMRRTQFAARALFHVVALPKEIVWFTYESVIHSPETNRPKKHSIMWAHVCASRITKTVLFSRSRLFSNASPINGAGPVCSARTIIM